jgi:endonuclease/exonuclease/phosphatase family metal-dependent hydrolase
MSSNAAAQVRAMTWNVWWRFGPRWRDRQPLILHTIRESAADVVALQESWGGTDSTQAQEFASALGFFAAFAEPSLPPRPQPPEHEEQRGVAIGLGLISRWPIAALRIVRLPSQHRSDAPVTMVATLEHPAGPLHVVVTCLEWQPEYRDDQLAQAAAITDLAGDPALDGRLPVLVLGDLNAPAGGVVHRALLETLADAWAAGGGDAGAVTLPADHPFAPVEASDLIGRRIDHILMRPGYEGQQLEVRRARLAGSAVDGLDPSDHRAVVCDIAWSDPA